MLRNALIITLLMFLGNGAFAAHLMGGEITWRALGGDDYQFTLVIYRDCNGLEIIDPTQEIRVWNHPSVNSIICNFISDADLSPVCTEVLGGPAMLDCGIGTGGGTGPGAVQKFVYQSGVVTLAGTPPPEGWAFTYDDFSRNWDLTNLDDPYAYGFTLYSIMYARPDACLDSSPGFAQDPYMLLCENSDFQFDANAFDIDNDSLVFSWGVPLDHFPSGDFNPPINPPPVPFNPGFSFDNPTPDDTFDPGNIPATMDPQTGSISFLSNTPGNFGFAQKIDCYREGVLISTVHRESQLIVIPCPGYDNSAPTITPPFDGGTSFEAVFYAGDLINFDIEIIDEEFLQDGTPQTVTLIPTGSYFGTGLTDDGSGCDYLPCATLDEPPIISGEQGLTVNFNWQTSCDHLLDACGVQRQEQLYTFVLNAKDDYCAVPGRTYETVRIILKNSLAVEPADLHCVDVSNDGSVDLTWTPSVDPEGTFEEYQIWSLEDGLIATIPTIGTDFFNVAAADADLGSKSYYILTKFGCEGGSTSSSDTLSSMFLEMTDLGDGRVNLEWNALADPINDGDAPFYEIYREYPAGTWTLRKQVPYGTNMVLDTIDVCEAYLSYEVRVANDAGCSSTSNIVGDDLEDDINPYIPVLDWVTVNPISEFVDLSWNVNPAQDTYGYIIYRQDAPFWEEVDTVWGRLNTEYTYVPTTSDIEPEGFRVAAFDSCFTDFGTYQTSAMSLDPHFTMYLQQEYDLCSRTINLEWTPYVGWTDEIAKYEVLVSIGGSSYEVIGTITSADLRYAHTELLYDVNYCYYIRAVTVNDTISLSNRVCQVAESPGRPDFHYIATATHELSGDIELLVYTDEDASVERYELEVKDPYSTDFQYLGEMLPLTGGSYFTFLDEEVFPERGEYQYRVNLIDTCGNIGTASNVARTSFLQVQTNHVEMKHILNWSSYGGFDGAIVRYEIYRGENGVFGDAPIGTTLPGVRSYVDDVSAFTESQGQFCYRVKAVEAINTYGFAETSFSNTVCATLDPIVYIPNAFIVNGENPIFLPVISLYDFDSYQLRIYDRWGGEIFSTSDRYEGWNGLNTSLGGYHAQGVYVYQLTFEDRDGQFYDYRGTVTMLVDGF